METIIKAIQYKVLERLIDQNYEYIKMKINDINSNFIFGRTMSLGKWFEFFLGEELAKELDRNLILVDTCITTIKKYPCKNESAKKQRKSIYADLLILDKIGKEKLVSIQDDIKDIKKAIRQHNEKVITENGVSEKGYEVTQFYEVKAIIETKIDPGYIKINDLNDSFQRMNDFINNKEGFTFKKQVQFPNGKEDFLQNFLFFNPDNIQKFLVLSTEANHAERVESIRELCDKEGYKYISLTDSSIHIRSIRRGDKNWEKIMNRKKDELFSELAD